MFLTDFFNQFVDRCKVENANAAEHLHLLRERFVEITMELLRLSIRLVQSTKQNNGAMTTGKSFKDIKHYLLVALDHVQLQTINYSSRAGVDGTKQQLLGTITQKLRDHLG